MQSLRQQMENSACGKENCVLCRDPAMPSLRSPRALVDPCPRSLVDPFPQEHHTPGAVCNCPSFPVRGQSPV